MQLLHYIRQDFGPFPEIEAAVLRDQMHTKKPAIGTETLLHVETSLLHGAVRGSAYTACPTQLLKGEDKLKNEKLEKEKNPVIVGGFFCLVDFGFVFLCVCACICFFLNFRIVQQNYLIKF